MLSVQEHILDLSRWHPVLPCFEWKQCAFALMMELSTKGLRRDDLTSVVVFGRLDIVSTSLVGGIKAVIKQRSVTPKVLPPSNMYALRCARDRPASTLLRPMRSQEKSRTKSIANTVATRGGMQLSLFPQVANT